MVGLGLCNASLKDDKTLMKMGLSMVLVGHINFLLGALVHGAVLRHISLHKQARATEYAVSNLIALAAGMVGAIVGISAIVLSKNRKNKTLMWFLLVVSTLCSLLAAASVLGLCVSVGKAIANGGRSLLTHCKFPDAIGYSSITNECPFDPTRIYGTTIFLWVPMVFLSVMELVFSGRCLAACASFLRLPCAVRKRRKRINVRRVRVWRPEEMTSPPQTECWHQGPEFQHQEVELPSPEVELQYQELEIQYKGVGLQRLEAEPQQQKEEPPEQHDLVRQLPRPRVSRAREFNRASLWI
ncbi:keratinocyte-associated protein 3-like [Anguilla anguilla]|uniref:keratinocyte-associated protein 3-like n=1 Tax=Anguilla anguilla TaxID=7936 RepID=UPI0015B3053F|nr:keratinocyte-associated protein 3-like [Anguilla anguilla]